MLVGQRDKWAWVEHPPKCQCGNDAVTTRFKMGVKTHKCLNHRKRSNDPCFVSATELLRRLWK